MHDSISAWDPGVYVCIRNEGTAIACVEVIWNQAFRWLVADFMLRIPEVFASSRTRTSKVRTGAIDDWNSETFVSLLLSAYGNVDSVHLAVTIGVKFRFDEQVVANPVFRILESFDNLSFAILDDRLVARNSLLSPSDRKQREECERCATQ